MKIFRLSLPTVHLSKRLCIYATIRAFSSKKNLSLPIATTYNAKEVECGWYNWWEENGFFRRYDAKEKFIMILPPPNVTGHLHLGHALTCAVQDALARWHQMNGKKVVWVPGCDHAGIATQVVVEKYLWATEHKTRHQLGKERFVSEILKWKDKKGTKIFEQMKQLGVSLDWSRAFYTMDNGMTESVNEAFIKLFNSGLVYRKMAMVNWCCELQSAVSNIEVEHLQLEGPTPLSVPGYEQPILFGEIYDFAYKVIDSDEEVIVSTTRPETMLGDTAVMVHPEDSKYKNVIGKQLYHPFRKEAIPVIADSCVDPDFGSGAVKVTPAHSAQDYEVGIRHNLQELTIFNEQGKVVMAEFKGLPRFTARASVLDALSKMGLYRNCKAHPMILPRCSRTNDIIEPLLKPQWYIKVGELASKAVSVVQSGNLRIYPENYKAVWYEWLAKDVQDWCISRQIWWGHRIPAYCIETNNCEEVWVASSSEKEAKMAFMETTGLPEDQIKSIKQDEDVLDTWFSSALLPFTVFGWPRSTNEFHQLYPTTLLETGHDILFFWVARMVMLGMQLTDKLPFQTVLLHGLIRDAQGQKMSKSKGNVLDPIDVINGASLEVLLDRISESEKQGVLSKQDASEAKKYQNVCFPKGIPLCGADALRISLCSYSVENQYVSVDVNRMEQYKFMSNKIWQVMRFLLNALEDVEAEGEKCCSTIKLLQRDELHLMDRWILSHLSGLVCSAEKSFLSYNLHCLVADFNHFLYKCLCDVYVESIKPVLKSENPAAKIASLQTLWTCMDTSLHILSPFMPFLTEELYQRLPRLSGKNDSIMQSYYPLVEEWKTWKDPALETQVQMLLDIGSALRSLKASYNVVGKYGNIEGSVYTEDQSLKQFVRESSSVVKTLSRIGLFSVLESDVEIPTMAAATTVSNVMNVYLHLEGLIDPALELQRLNKKKSKLKKSEADILKKINGKRFKRSPEHIQQSLQDKLATLNKEMDQLLSLIEAVEKFSKVKSS